MTFICECVYTVLCNAIVLKYSLTANCKISICRDVFLIKYDVCRWVTTTPSPLTSPFHFPNFLFSSSFFKLSCTCTWPHRGERRHGLSLVRGSPDGAFQVRTQPKDTLSVSLHLWGTHCTNRGLGWGGGLGVGRVWVVCHVTFPLWLSHRGEPVFLLWVLYRSSGFNKGCPSTCSCMKWHFVSHTFIVF